MAALPTNFCTVQPALDHDKLAPEARCPFCHCKEPPTQLALRAAEATPTAPSQYTPLGPGAVNAQLRATRGATVTAASTYRSQAITRAAVEAPSTPKVPSPFHFSVKASRSPPGALVTKGST